MAAPMLYTDDEVEEVRSLLLPLLAETSEVDEPRKHALLLRACVILSGYEKMLATLRAINHIPGRQFAGLPWLATLNSLLKEVFIHG